MDEGLSIRGGAGGTSAVVESLRQGARALACAADPLDDAGPSVRWAWQHGLRHGFGPSPSPGTLRAAQRDVEPLLRGPIALGVLAHDLRELARSVGCAADAYDAAEARAEGVVRPLLALWAQGAGRSPLLALAGSLLLVRALLPPVVLTAAGLRAAGVHLALPPATTDLAEGAVQLVAGFARGAAPGESALSTTPVPGAAGMLTGAAAVGGVVVPRLRRRPLQVTARLEAASRVPVPRDAADVLARVRALSPRSGGTAGTVGVDRLDHVDGTRSWLVTIPGTQRADSWGSSDNPMDMLTNVRLMAAARDDGSELVARALAQSGARPHEPVLLAGHSQGGIVATALAGSAAFTARHQVAGVLTAGSPVATHAVPGGTAALHLEHRQDLVPALDGWRNPDQPHRTTAQRDLAVSPSVADRWAARSAGSAHGLDAYVRTAAAVSAAGGPSVQGWERATAHVLGGPGTVVHHREFTGERVARDPSASAAPPSAPSSGLPGGPSGGPSSTPSSGGRGPRPGRATRGPVAGFDAAGLGVPALGPPGIPGVSASGPGPGPG